MIKIGFFNVTPKRKAQEILNFEIKRLFKDILHQLPDNTSITGNTDQEKVRKQIQSYEKRILKLLNPPKKED